jgi:hypothetical protein
MRRVTSNRAPLTALVHRLPHIIGFVNNNLFVRNFHSIEKMAQLTNGFSLCGLHVFRID